MTVMIIEQYVHRALELADQCLWSYDAARSHGRAKPQESGEEVLQHYLGESMTDDSVRGMQRFRQQRHSVSCKSARSIHDQGRGNMRQRKHNKKFLAAGVATAAC